MDESIDIAAFRALLIARERALLKEEADHDGSAEIVKLDQARVGRLSRIDALQAQQMAKASARRRRTERGRIAGALKRVDNGTYGYCVHCSAMIPSPRLRIDPATTQCVQCATNAES